MKTDPVQQLYNYIGSLDPEEVGFESHEGEEIAFELVLPPTPQVRILTDKSKTIEEEGLHPRGLINIK